MSPTIALLLETAIHKLPNVFGVTSKQNGKINLEFLFLEQTVKTLPTQKKRLTF